MPHTTIKHISSIEKGGLFVVLIVVLFMGYDIYTKGQEREEALIISQLATISQQQDTLQRTLINTQASIADGARANQNLLAKLERIETTMIQYVYATDQEIVLRAPKSAGGQLIKIPIAKGNEQ